MTLDLGTTLTLLLVIGFLAQWLGWRTHLPAILPLLLIGILLGPVTGWFDPDATLGPLLFPGVSLAVAIILFEGSLTLRFSELHGIGRAVHGMITYGAALAVIMLAVAAHWIADLTWGIAFLFGALTCVTGPTVIQPMLRTLRPTAHVANALRWEGIVLDPLGALFAVLVFQAVLTQLQDHSPGTFLVMVAVGVVAGLGAAAILATLIYQQWIPEYLQNYATLATVLGIFTLSNTLIHESGLLAVTVMGIVLGNLRIIHIDHIMTFKEDLSTLLVSVLFVILSARLQWPLPNGVLWAGILIFLAAQVIIRPISIFVATLGSQLSWRERALLSFVSPRGVVAAAISSLFALHLDDLGIEGADALVPLVFILIIATVVLQSATAHHLARWLGVLAPEPKGVLIFGSDTAARTIATALDQQKIDVILADDNWNMISQARMEGLKTFFGNPTSRTAELHLDLTPIGHFLAISGRRELNYLACLHYREELGREAVYRMRVLKPDDTTDRQTFAGKLRSKVLFNPDMTQLKFNELLSQGWTIKSNELTNVFGWPEFLAQHGQDAILLFGIDPTGQLKIANDKYKTEPRNGWTVIALVPPSHNKADNSDAQ
ncbi:MULTISPECIES: cation:proton antiporter [Nitrosomonas]|uniref:Sodium/proton antiporter (CPA1 family) n=2 Tax=Nitrosomonas eutropha TaxID=916 RepID=A0ABX5ME66_9PROT|nr:MULTISPECIES: sodium:proton antiporter [Nitrosomonas]ABI59236.1 sodium/proton antiporter, CPA1 family [Nitrosomonas eutropha C91]MXS79291.1 sodium:proton antiporter [Nitrosomonas sp. GH22]PXV83400.1 sodium/proton antiporter (CPA1 family) [Nitrosomonas eutropha]SDW62910.1 sodium/proton antiporter, CPA1 family [Nitrosomonas eutropha]SEI61197.1 sodium/proton antiporter, CPA1 family [Nitrosomonas eutropha]